MQKRKTLKIMLQNYNKTLQNNKKHDKIMTKHYKTRKKILKKKKLKKNPIKTFITFE